ncbi:hypothetical protein X977_4900 [Burkholderia pseudomallei MSHR7504]|nr:hypothetical protein X977_4900 [Burkholderia pseudomallei MSHR7504]
MLWKPSFVRNSVSPRLTCRVEQISASSFANSWVFRSTGMQTLRIAQLEQRAAVRLAASSRFAARNGTVTRCCAGV